MRNMWLGRYVVLLGAALSLVIIGWRPTAAHDGHEHGDAVKPGKQPQPAVRVAPAPRITAPSPPRRHTGKISDRFLNTVLMTQDNTPVRFYDDLVKDRTVIINFMYTTCYDICPGTTGNLMRVHQYLGERMGRDILMLSISIDPDVDTPAALRKYAARYGGDKKGWLFLTGKYDEIEALRHALGVYDLDPVLDVDKTQHSGIITFGNDKTDRWAALPALMDSLGIARTILRLTW